MKKLVIFVLAMALLLTACGSAPKDEADFGVSVAEVTTKLAEKAKSLSVNVFEKEAEVLDVDYGTGYAYLIGDGVRMAIYGTDEDLLTSIYLSATVKELTEDSQMLLQEYSGMLMEYFVPADELESVTKQLGVYDKVGDMLSGTVNASTCVINMMGDGAVTYVSIYPPEPTE